MTGLILVLGLLVGLAQRASAPGRVEASSPRLVKVTVFPDRAEIVREAKVDLAVVGLEGGMPDRD